MNAENLTGGAILASEAADGDLIYWWDVSSSGIARTKSMTRKEARRALAGRGGGASANESGNTTITPGAFIGDHLEVVTVTGIARTSVLILTAGDGTTRYAYERMAILLRLPQTASIVLQVRNAAVDGTLLFELTTDGGGEDALLEFYHDGAAWQPLRATYPNSTGL